MAVFAFPPALCPTKFGMQVVGNVWINQSPMNKATTRVEVPGSLWVMRAEFPPMGREEFRPIRAFFNRFRGQANTLRVWDLAHEAPYGTLRGAPTLASSAVEFANAIVVTGTAGATLIAGDLLGVTLATGFVQLVEVVGVSGTGTINVDINPPLRRAASAGAAIVWDKPYVDMILTTPPFPMDIVAVSDGFAFEAIEKATV